MKNERKEQEPDNFYQDFPQENPFYHEDYDHGDPNAFEEYFMPFGEAYFNERNGR